MSKIDNPTERTDKSSDKISELSDSTDYSSTQRNTVAEQVNTYSEMTKGTEDGSCETDKDNIIKCKPFTFVDNPNKPEFPSPYLNRVLKLEKSNRNFELVDFQKIRKEINRTQVIDLYKRIGTIINDIDVSDLPKENFDKICFILVNSCNNDYDYFGYGPFNDAYVVAKFHKDLGYNVALLYNPKSSVFLQYLEHFLKYTKKAFTFYYTGKNAITKKSIDYGIRFNDDTIIYQDDLANFFFEKCNEKTKIIILSDCYSDGSIINMGKILELIEKTSKHFIEIISFDVNKKKLKTKYKKLTHGLLTYYFCTLIKHYPNVCPNELICMLNGAFLRFKISFKLLSTQDETGDQVFFGDAHNAFTPKTDSEPTN